MLCGQLNKNNLTRTYLSNTFTTTVQADYWRILSWSIDQMPSWPFWNETINLNTRERQYTNTSSVKRLSREHKKKERLHQRWSAKNSTSTESVPLPAISWWASCIAMATLENNTSYPHGNWFYKFSIFNWNLSYNHYVPIK